MRDAWDLVVVGGGAGGLISALGAAHLGAKVALVEAADRLGGDCLHFGCVPSKALIHAARRVQTAREAAPLGAPVWAGVARLAAVAAEVDRAVARIQAHDDPKRFEAAGVAVMLGQRARLEGPGRLRVGDRLLQARRVILATGSRPTIPPIPGLAGCPHLTNESFFAALPTLRGRIGVLGGGPVGVELAQALCRLGLEVHLWEAGPRLLPQEDADAAELVAQGLRQEGLRLHLGAPVVRLWRAEEAQAPSWAGPQPLAIVAEGADPVGLDHLLVAAGRRPNTEGLGLEAAGVVHGPRGVRVGPDMATSCPGHYAVGDLAEGPSFTHVAEAQAKVALRNALVLPGGRFDPDAVPRCTFSDPELAQLGPTLAACGEQGWRVSAHRFPFAQCDRSVAEGRTEGWVQLNLDPKGRILGATVVGQQAGELIHELALARAQGLPAKAISQLIHAYPTRALALRRAADASQSLRLQGWEGRLLRSWVRWMARWA